MPTKKKSALPTKYIIHLMSESGDHSYVKIPVGETFPERDGKAQLAMILKYEPGLADDGDGPGIGDSWLHIQAIVEV